MTRRPLDDDDDRALPASERWLYDRSARGLLRLGARVLSRGYAAAQHARARPRRTRRAPVPVISIGSLLVGGAGKTPAALWCAETLSEHTERPVVIALRGYGRHDPRPHLITAGAPVPDWRAIGDEAAMLARALPQNGRHLLAVGADRAAGIAAALARSPTLAAAVLDDGFQHRRLARDLDVVLMPPSDAGLEVLPAGPLREPLSALARADVVWRHAGDGRLPDAIDPATVVSRYTLRDHWRPLDGAVCSPDGLGGVCLVTAIGRNHNARALAEDAGARVIEHIALRDHRAFPRRAIQRLRASVAPILTTAKDLPRLTATLDDRDEVCERLWVMRVALRFERGEDVLRRALLEVIPR